MIYSALACLYLTLSVGNGCDIGCLLKDDIPIDMGPTKVFELRSFVDQTLFHWSDYKQNQVVRTHAIDFKVKTVLSNEGFFVPAFENLTVQVLLTKNAMPVPSVLAQNLPASVIVNSNPFYKMEFSLSETSKTADYHLSLDGFEEINSANRYFVSMFLLPVEKSFMHSESLTKVWDVFGSVKVYQKTYKASLSMLFPPIFELSGNEVEARDIQFSSINTNLLTLSSFVVKDSYTIFKWYIHPFRDVGKTLSLQMRMFSDAESGFFKACISQNKKLNQVPCEEGHSVSFKRNQNNDGFVCEALVPYPRAGYWYVSFRDFASVEKDVLLDMNVTLVECKKSCGGNGKCEANRVGSFSYTGCSCFLGWTGVTCHQSLVKMEKQVLDFMCLVFSNLLFLFPCYMFYARGYYIEAFIFAAIYISSTFYHLCDPSAHLAVCVLKYDTLQFMDVVFALSGLYYSAIAVARLKSATTVALLQVAGIYILVLFTTIERFSMLTSVSPVAFGISLIAYSFCKQSISLGRLYPHKEILLKSVIPGILVAFAGFIMYLFANARNYFLVHSLWHIFISLSGFILVPRERKANVLLTVPKAYHKSAS